MNNKQIMTQKEIATFILTGCQYEYMSYNHKAAAEDYKALPPEKKLPFIGVPQCYDMPKELKEKHAIKKVGKLRSIEFSPDGTMRRFKIGAKYSKSYSAADFGDTVKPIIDIRIDKWKLVNRGLAIDKQTKKQ